MRTLFSILFLSLIHIGLSAQSSELEEKLFALPDVQFTAMPAAEGIAAAYVLKVRQPLDHQHPEKGSFWQRVYLEHVGFDRPTTIVTHGYNVPSDKRYEMAELLKGNQLLVEHRFFGESVPDSIDYTYLNLTQATADYHHIRELFRTLYPEKWVSTGISKGGQTTIFYRYFYPNDVAVSFPLVAPINFSAEDQRIYTFLDTVGTDACRKALYDVQTYLLRHRQEILPRARWYAKGANLTFTYLTLEQALEYTILEYPFSFWQWGSHCDEIPGPEVGIDSMLSHVFKISDLGFFSDRDILDYASHYYQAGTEVGYYGYQTKPFAGLLKALPTDHNATAIFMPGHAPIPFNGNLTNTVYNWTQTKGTHIAYLYGSADTWSATAVPKSDKVDSAWFFLPSTDHRAARVKNLSPAERARFVSVLERWLDMEIE
ncbi:MAG: hypothetical protein K9I85_04295 [Saprospiraceae bacterium]|nr:hypothetical protein [Saprospiraceae bacterium]